MPGGRHADGHRDDRDAPAGGRPRRASRRRKSCCASPTPARACRPRCWRVSSSRTSRPRPAARAPASACPPSTPSSRRAAAASRSRASRGVGTTFTIVLPLALPPEFGTIGGHRHPFGAGGLDGSAPADHPRRRGRGAGAAARDQRAQAGRLPRAGRPRTRTSAMAPPARARQPDRPAADRRHHAGPQRPRAGTRGPAFQPGLPVLFMSGYADRTFGPGRAGRPRRRVPAEAVRARRARRARR